MAHEEITQIQRFIGNGSNLPTDALPGSIYYKVNDQNKIEKLMFYDDGWYPEEDGGD